MRTRFTSADLREEAWTADAGSRCSNRLFLCSGSAAATATCCAQVAATLENPDKAAVEEELRALFAALGG